MFTYGFELNKDEFGMKASNGVTYLFSFRKYPNVNYPMAYIPKDDSIVLFLFKEIGSRKFESHVLIALCEEHIHRILTKYGIPREMQHEIWYRLLSELFDIDYRMWFLSLLFSEPLLKMET